MLGWVPRTVQPALSFGTAFHAGKAVFYKSRRETKAIQAAMDRLQEDREGFEDREVFRKNAERLRVLTKAWIERYGFQDLKNYDVVEVESEHSVALEGGFFMTCRLDALMRSKTSGQLLIFETKTTGSSTSLTEFSLFLSDQVTTYIAAVLQDYPKEHFAGLLPDIACWLKNSLDPAKITLYRGELLIREPEELDHFRLYMAQLLSEITQYTKAVLQDGKDPHGAFPRCTISCVSYARLCDYGSICRSVLEYDRTPHGFRKEEKDAEGSVLASLRPGR